MLSVLRPTKCLAETLEEVLRPPCQAQRSFLERLFIGLNARLYMQREPMVGRESDLQPHAGLSHADLATAWLCGISQECPCLETETASCYAPLQCVSKAAGADGSLLSPRKHLMPRAAHSEGDFISQPLLTPTGHAGIWAEFKLRQEGNHCTADLQSCQCLSQTISATTMVGRLLHAAP